MREKIIASLLLSWVVLGGLYLKKKVFGKARKKQDESLSRGQEEV